MRDPDLPPITLSGPDASEIGWVIEVGVSKKRADAMKDAFDSGRTFDSKEELEEYIQRKDETKKQRE